MNNTYKLAALAFLTLMALNGCESKTENNIQASIEASKTLQESRNIEITHNKTIETKEKSYKTVSYYSKHKEEREKKFRVCAEALKSNYKNDKECDNVLRSKQLERRENTRAFIQQKF